MQAGRRLRGAGLGNRWLATCVAAWLGLATPARAIEVTAVEPVVETAPGQAVTLRFGVTSDRQEQVTPSLVVPPGWRVVLPDEAFAVGPGQSSLRIVVIEVPADAASGEHVVQYRPDPDAETAGGVAIRVGRVDAVRLDVMAAKATARPGERVRFHYEITNLGNSTLPLRAAIEVAGGLVAGAVVRRHEPGPGATEIDEVVVRAGAEADRIRVVVRLAESGTGAFRATRSAEVPVVRPSRLADRSVIFPASVALWNITGTGTDAQLRTAFQLDVKGAGALDAHRHLYGDVRLRGPTVGSVAGLARYDEYRVAVQGSWDRMGFSARGGDHYYALTTLTQLGRLGRGGELVGGVGDLRAGVQVFQARFRPDPAWRAGGFFRYERADRIRLGVNAQWSEDRGGALVLSQDGRVELLPKSLRHQLAVAWEVAQSALAPAVHGELFGRDRAFRYHLRATWGSVDYAGEFRGRQIYAADLWGRLGPVELAPYIRYETTSAFIPDLARPHQVFTAGALARVRAGRTLRLDARWRRFDRTDELGAEILRERQDTLEVDTAWTRGPLRLWTALGGRVRLPRGTDTEVGALFALARVEYALRNGLGFGVAGRADTNASMRLDPVPLYGGEVWAGWRRGRTQAVRIGWRSDFYFGDHPQQRHSLTALAGLQLPFGHRVHLRSLAWLSKNAGAPYRLELYVGYEVPFGIPAGKRSDVGLVAGTITDGETGEPVRGIPVAADGRQAITGRRGTFEVAVDPDGAHRLEILEHGLDGFVLTQDNPVFFTFDPEAGEGDQARFDFEVTRAGQLRLRFVQYDAASRYVVGEREPELVEAGPLAHRTVRLRRGEEVLQLRTDADGWVVGRRLRPGTWRLSFAPGAMPPDHALQEHEILLQAGEVVEREVRVTPVFREVKMGEVGPFEAPDHPLKPRLRALRVEPGAIVVKLGERADVRATAVYVDDSRADVTESATWIVESDTVARAEGGGVVGAAVGTTRVTARLGPVLGNPVVVEVVDVPVVGLNLLPETLRLVVGQTGRLFATAIYSDGSTALVGEGVEWSTSDDAVVQVRPDGQVRALARGEVDIGARLGGVTAYPVRVIVGAER